MNTQKIKNSTFLKLISQILRKTTSPLIISIMNKSEAVRHRRPKTTPNKRRPKVKENRRTFGSSGDVDFGLI